MSAAVDALAGLLSPTSSSVLRPALTHDVPLLLAALPGGVRVAFTTRIGGASAGGYATLNLGLHTDDRKDDVAENRRRLAAALTPLGFPGSGPAAEPMLAGPGSPASRFVTPRQVHGVRVAGTSEYRREAGDRAFAQRPGCDGLILRPALDAGLAPLLLFADCVPVVLASEVDVAVVHGGWQGLLAGVVQQAARAMTAPPGLALVGPSIGPCCYEVSHQLADAFRQRYGAEVVVGGRLLDLWEVVARALEEVEVPRVRVTNPRLCTSCHPELFFSHRRDGPGTGRQGAVAWAAGRQER